MAFYSGGGQEPAAVLRLERGRKGYERRGFFRIGALPIGMVEGVRLEIRDPDAVAASLAQVHEWFGRGGNRLELRQVQLTVGGGRTNRLECAGARPRADGRWELFDGVTFTSGTNRVQARSAYLQATGPAAGLLLLQTKPRLTNFLFRACAETSNHSNRSTKHL